MKYIKPGRRGAFPAALVLVALYAVIRSLGLPEPLLMVWTVAAAVASAIAPVAGLTLLAALGPFVGAVEDDGRITAVPFLLAGTGIGGLVGLASASARATLRPVFRRAAPWALPAGVLLAGTALGVARSWLAFGPERGGAAAELWVPGIGGGLTVLFVSALVALLGERRPVVVLAGSITAAAALSMADLWTSGAVNATAVGWLLHDQIDLTRLLGIILAPNAAAAIYGVGLAVAAAAVVWCADQRLRILATGTAAICGLALALTFSRSAMIAVAIGALLIGWNRARWRGVGAALSVSIAAATAVVLLTNGDLVRDVPAIADQQRIDAWRGSLRMWLDSPLVGHGFRSFEWLHRPPYGSILDAPHNEWLRFFAEEGLFVGLAGLVFAVVVPVTLVRTRGGYLPAAAAATAAGVFVMACFNNPFLYTQVNVPTFLVIGTGLGVALARAEP